MKGTLAGAKLGELKSRAQLLKPIVKVGKEGLTESFLKGLEEALNHQELVKVKFEHHKEDKRELAPLLAERTNSRLIARVGNTAVLFRPRPQQTPSYE